MIKTTTSDSVVTMIVGEKLNFFGTPA